VGTMIKAAGVVAAVLLAFAAGAYAGTSWHVFASGTDSSDYGAYANANADVLKPHALAIRSTKAAKVSWNVICSSADDLKASANQVIIVDVAAAAKCSLNASANTDTKGKVTIQLLRK
jgi:hypothetical protein